VVIYSRSRCTIMTTYINGKVASLQLTVSATESSVITDLVGLLHYNSTVLHSDKRGISAHMQSMCITLIVE